MIFSKAKALAGCLALLLVASMPVAAQSKSMTRQEQANLKFVLDFERDVFAGHHVELASKYLAEDYIQHNPSVPTGRAGFVEFFSHMPTPATPPSAAAAAMFTPVISFAKGDYVVLIYEHEGKDPADPSKTYKFNAFDVFRIQNGKIQEHWDNGMKSSPAPPAL
jgi:predicted SnoaL-like aldol condensation-catalyzing enzyme